MDLLLGDVLVVRDRTAARRVLSGQSRNARAVTLKGEVFYATGQVLAGKPSKVGTLSRPRQRRELKESLAEVERTLNEVDAQIRQLSGQLDTARQEALTGQDLLKKNAPVWKTLVPMNGRRVSAPRQPNANWIGR